MSSWGLDGGRYEYMRVRSRKLQGLWHAQLCRQLIPPIKPARSRPLEKAGCDSANEPSHLRNSVRVQVSASLRCMADDAGLSGLFETLGPAEASHIS